MLSWWKKITDWFAGRDIAGEISTVQALVVQSCGYLPTVATVAAILTAGNATVVGVANVAKAICATVTAHRTGVYSLLSDAPLTVNGVEIDGQFVR